MSKMLMTEALNQTFLTEMERDPSIFFIAESVKGTVFGLGGPPLIEKFGMGRVLDAPITEAGFAAACVGAAMRGKRPICDLMFGDFFSLGYQAVVNEAAKMRYVSNGKATVPVVFLGAQGIGVTGGIHHSNNVEGLLMQAPGLVVVTPSNPADAVGLMRSALRGNNPVAFLVHKTGLASKGEVPEGDYTVPFGKADVVKEGDDVTVIASQLMRDFATQAIAEVEKDGISVELIDPRTILPFDREAFAKSAKKTGRVVIVQEAPETGGVAAEFAAAIQEDCFHELKAPVKRVCGFNGSICYGPEEIEMVPNQDEIAAAIRAIVK